MLSPKKKNQDVISFYVKIVQVYEAPPECVMSKENCISIRPFVQSESECQQLCQKSKNCGYYKYIKGECR